MKNYSVSFTEKDKIISVPEGTTILEAAQRAGICINAACGGNGTCGKCLVHVSKGNPSGILKACCVRVECDITVDRVIDSNDGNNAENILSGGLCREIGLSPCIKISPDCKSYAVAFDIGTTTVVGYLVDLGTGRTLSSYGVLNPQGQYCADVIGRASYAVKHGVSSMKDPLDKALDDVILNLFSSGSVTKDSIRLITVAGNTCMQHIAAGIIPASLLKPPYGPEKFGSFFENAGDIGINSVSFYTPVLFLPVIAGFIGADTTAAMMAVDFASEKQISLLIDIGTNGEMVLSKGGKMIACSAAAGPAFEGAEIACGMRCKSGAVCSVEYKDEMLSFKVFDSVAPVGIAGSGLIDLIAALISAGVIKKDGAFEKIENMPPYFADRMSEIDNTKVFMLDNNVYISQKDIRKVQLAKSAVCSGILLMCKEFGIVPDDIEKVLLAGAFGSSLNPVSSAAIGLIPPELAKRIIPVGNAAGEGAVIAAKNYDELKRYENIAENVEFLELGGKPEFQETFIENLSF